MTRCAYSRKAAAGPRCPCWMGLTLDGLLPPPPPLVLRPVLVLVLRLRLALYLRTRGAAVTARAAPTRSLCVMRGGVGPGVGVGRWCLLDWGAMHGTGRSDD